MSAEQAVLSDLHIVADLHQCVDLGAVTNACRPDRAGIDAGIGADLDIVPDHDAAKRMDLQPCLPSFAITGSAKRLTHGLNRGFLGRHKTEPVGTDNHTGMRYEAMANPDVSPDPDPCKDQRVLANLGRPLRRMTWPSIRLRAPMTTPGPITT